MERINGIIYAILMMIALASCGIGYLILYSDKKMRESCIFKIPGKVVEYKTKGTPTYIVEYSVSGTKYREKYEYRRVSRLPSFLYANKNQPIFLDGANVLHIMMGAKYNKEEFLKKLAPMNSRVNVFYSEKDPKDSYVKEVPTYNPHIANIFLGIGMFFLGTGLIFQWLVK